MFWWKMAAGISTVAQVINPLGGGKAERFRTNEFRGLKGGEGWNR